MTDLSDARAVEALIIDLIRRRRMGWESIDPDVQREIRETWEKILGEHRTREVAHLRSQRDQLSADVKAKEELLAEMQKKLDETQVEADKELQQECARLAERLNELEGPASVVAQLSRVASALESIADRVPLQHSTKL